MRQLVATAGQRLRPMRNRPTRMGPGRARLRRLLRRPRHVFAPENAQTAF